MRQHGAALCRNQNNSTEHPPPAAILGLETLCLPGPEDMRSSAIKRTAIAAPWCSASAASPVSWNSGRATPSMNARRKSERHALEQIEKLQAAAARDGDFTELFRLLGTSEAQRAIDG